MKKIVLLMLSLVYSTSIYPQAEMKIKYWRSTEVDSLGIAQAMFEDQNFVLALPIYDNLQQQHPYELYLKYVTGICGLYRSDKYEQSMNFLKEVYEKRSSAENIEYYLAKAYHYNYKFEDALSLLDQYLKRKNISTPQKRNALQLAEYCDNARTLVASPVKATIDNMGVEINSVNAEYVPLVSSDESVIIFTYRGMASTGGLQNDLLQSDSLGMYYEDVFISHKENETWSTPASIGTEVNTNEHDAAIGISNDGQKLFIFKDGETDGGDIYMSELKNNDWTTPQRLTGEVNTKEWEGSASLSADGKTLYFSSERAGGHGGKDIYKATLNSDGSWGNVTNLGPTVNTSADDDAPFIHPDGKTLLYSSKGLNSMGGYDIFKTTLSFEDGSWNVPENLGYPINTPDDDIYFTLSTDGKKGYYASGKSGGYGLQDIYVVDMPDNFQKPVVEMVKGTATIDDQPIQLTIQVDVVDTKQPYGTFTSNATYGNYLVNLPPGHVYQFTYKLQNFIDQVQIVDATHITEYTEKGIELKYSTTNTVAQSH